MQSQEELRPAGETEPSSASSSEPSSAVSSESPSDRSGGGPADLPSPSSATGGAPDSALDERAQDLLLAGQEAFEQGDYERAMALLDSAETFTPNASVVPYNRGRVYTALNRAPAARSAFEEAIRRNPSYPEARRRLGDLELDRGNLNSALDYYRGEEEIEPTSHLYVQMGETYSRLGRSDSARWAYERAIELDGSNANAHMMYGQFLEEIGNLEEAVSHSRRALELAPDRPNYQFAVGSQLYQRGRLEEAVPHLKDAADARLLHYPAQYNLGQALMRLGREEEAERYLARADSSRSLMDQITSAQSAASRNPRSVEQWIRLGELFRRAGERDRAVQAFNRAATLDPKNLRVHRNIGEMMLAEGDEEGAIRRFRSILQADRSRVEVWRKLARAYASAGDCDQARETVSTALDLNLDETRLDGVLDGTCR